MKNERENQSILYLRKLDEEDLLYREYQAVNKRIEFLKNYIESLNCLFTDKKIEELYDEEFKNINYTYLLAKYRSDVSKEIMTEEHKRIKPIIEKEAKNKKSDNEVNNSEEDKLCSFDTNYLKAKEEFEDAYKKEMKEKKVLDDYVIYGHSEIRKNLNDVKNEIARSYDEIRSLENKKVEIIEKMDYIVYGEQKVKRR